MSWVRTALLAALCLAFPAQAQEKRERIRYSTQWVAGQPLSQLDGVLPKVGEEASLSRGDMVLASRLFPKEITRLGSSITDAKGKTLAPVGQEFFSISAWKGQIFCSPRAKQPGAVSQFLFGGAETHLICLVDADDDGGFESYFKKGSDIKGLPSFRGRTPSRPKAIEPVTYMTLPGEEMEYFLFVALEYRGNANLGGNHVFETIFGNADTRENLTQRWVVKDEEVPKALTFLGGRFEVLSGDKNAVNLTVMQATQSVSFGVNRTVEYSFY